MLRTLAVAGLIGGAVYAASKYLKALPASDAGNGPDVYGGISGNPGTNTYKQQGSTSGSSRTGTAPGR